MFHNTTYRHLILLLVALAGSLMISCRKIPKFSETPSIQYLNISVTPYYNADQPIAGGNPGDPSADSVVVGIHVEDGNGDIGEEESKRDSNNINFFVDVYRSNNGVFEIVDLGGVTYNGYTPLLSPVSTPGPIEGDIFYKMTFNYSFGQVPNDTLKFVVKLKDRAGNFSNSVETEPAILRKTP